MNKIDVKAYEAKFVSQISQLQGAEKTTRAVLMDLSRSVLEVHHVTEDIGYINRLITSVTPVNRKALVLYFQTFSGFSYDDKSGVFGKKHKPTYEAKKQAAIDFLDDPLNNFWTWASREITVEAKEFKLESVNKYMTSTLKKAAAAGFTAKDVLNEVLKAGITEEDVLALIGQLYNIDVE